MIGARRRRACWLATALAVAITSGWAEARGQGPAPLPMPPTGPAPIPATSRPGRRPGPICRTVRCVGRTLQDKLIGYPEYFIEPPLGFHVAETFGAQKAKADVHDFYVYRSDFVDGTATLSPVGAQRLTLMANRLPKWLGPVVVEWTPDRPGLADSRRSAILETLRGASVPIDPDRVVIGPSPYPGLLGADGELNYNTMIGRDAAAGRAFPLSPAQAASPTGAR